MLQYYVTTYIELIYRIDIHSWATQLLENGEHQLQSIRMMLTVEHHNPNSQKLYSVSVEHLSF